MEKLVAILFKTPLDGTVIYYIGSNRNRRNGETG